MIHDPEILIFDEPCTGLDPAGMYYIRKAMEDIASSGSKTVILVTHYPEDIVCGIDRILFVKDGKIVADDSRGALLRDEALSELFEVPIRLCKSENL